MNFNDNDDYIIEVKFEEALVFKKNIELLKKILNTEFQIIFYKDKFNIYCKNQFNNLICFLNYNKLKENYKYKVKNKNGELLENYIITIDIGNLNDLLKNISDSNTMIMYIEKNSEDLLQIKFKDDYNEIQNFNIKLCYTNPNDNFMVNLDEITRDTHIYCDSKKFKDYCKKLFTNINKEVVLDLNENKLMLKSFSNTKLFNLTYNITNITYKKIDDDIKKLSSVYSLEHLTYINDALCGCSNIHLSFYINRNDTKNNILIVEYVITGNTYDDEGNKLEYGRVKYILSPVINK